MQSLLSLPLQLYHLIKYLFKIKREPLFIYFITFCGFSLKRWIFDSKVVFMHTFWALSCVNWVLWIEPTHVLWYIAFLWSISSTSFYVQTKIKPTSIVIIWFFPELKIIHRRKSTLSYFLSWYISSSNRYLTRIVVINYDLI